MTMAKALNEGLRKAMEAEPLFKRQQKELGDALKVMVYGVLGKGSEVVGLREHYGACQVFVYEEAFRKLEAQGEVRPRDGKMWLLIESERPGKDLGAWAESGALALFALARVALGVETPPCNLRAPYPSVGR